MKGIILTEFLDHVRRSFDERSVSELLTQWRPGASGRYAASQSYDWNELPQLVAVLAAQKQLPAAELLRSFGRVLFLRFGHLYPSFMATATEPFEFLDQVEHSIHRDVRKLYPDAELPTLNTISRGADSMTIEYRSTRPFAQFARGLIEGCCAHFGVDVEIEERTRTTATGTATIFSLQKVATRV